MPGINKCMIFSASSSLWDRISIKCIIISELSPSPFPASANICNVGLMRHNELSEGIDVLDNNGNVVGSSKIAARHVRALFHFCMHDSRLKSKRHLISWKKNKIKLSVWNGACAQCSLSPGNHGNCLYTCGPPNANLRPAPHHYVLPREVCAEIHC